jgi:hypothetical protein
MTGRHRAPAKHNDWLRDLTGVAIAAILLAGLRGPAESSVAAAAAPPPPEPTWEIVPVSAETVARPVRVRIPAIGVDSTIVDIGVDKSGALLPPSKTDTTGWFTGGPAPGAIGPALLTGHVDSYTGPAVFYKLIDLRPGDAVLVDRADGSTATFTITSVTRVPKTAFPKDLVYAPMPVPLLRLITCGGTFDHAAHSYRDNVIAEASPS